MSPGTEESARCRPSMWRDVAAVVLLVTGLTLGAIAALDWVGYSTFVLLTWVS